MGEYKSLDTLLRDCKCDDNSEVTHTKIGNRDLAIYGGKYKIDDPQTIKSFIQLYHQKVFVNEEFEFLTEKQLDSGMITLDFDLHYPTDVEERKHNENHIVDLVEMYLEAIEELVNVEKNTPSALKGNLTPIAFCFGQTFETASKTSKGNRMRSSRDPPYWSFLRLLRGDKN